MIDSIGNHVLSIKMTLFSSRKLIKEAPHNSFIWFFFILQEYLFQYKKFYVNNYINPKEEYYKR